MFFAYLFAIVAQAAATPNAEAIELGREVSRGGMLATLIPLKTGSEIEEMITENPDLTVEEQEKLRAIGKAQADALFERVLDIEGRALAQNLSLEDLRTIAAYERSDAAARKRAAMVPIMVATVTALDGLDYGGGVKAAFCTQTGKLCDPKD